MQTIKCYASLCSEIVRPKFVWNRNSEEKNDAQSKRRERNRLKVHHQNAVKVFDNADRNEETFVFAIAFDASFKVITDHQYVNGSQLRLKRETRQKRNVSALEITKMRLFGLMIASKSIAEFVMKCRQKNWFRVFSFPVTRIYIRNRIRCNSIRWFQLTSFEWIIFQGSHK